MRMAYLHEQQRANAQHHGQTFEAHVRMGHMLVPVLIGRGLPQQITQKEQQAQYGRAKHEQHKEQMQAESDEEQPLHPAFGQGFVEKQVCPLLHGYFSLAACWARRE